MITVKYGTKYFQKPKLAIKISNLYGEDGKKLIGWKEVWIIRDHISGPNAQAITTEINSWRLAMTVEEQLLLLVEYPGETVLQSLDPTMLESGPRLTSFLPLEEKSGSIGTKIDFEVRFEGMWALSENGIIDQDHTTKYDTDEAGLTVRTKEGHIKTTSSVSALGKLSAADPGTPSGYTRSQETWKVSDDDTLVRYAFTDRQLNSELPADTVQGQATTTTQTDSDGLTRFVVQGKFKGTGAATAALSYKPSGEGVYIFEQEVEPDDFNGTVRFRYVYRRNENSDPTEQDTNLLAFTETLALRDTCATTSFVTINYPEQVPYKFVSGAQTIQAQQQGYAIGLDAYPDPAEALFDSTHYSDRPEITYHAPTLNSDGEFIDWKIEWKYRYEFASAATVPGLLSKRPTKRTIYE